MYRTLLLIITAVSLAAPASAQSSAERARERERERIEREREQRERDAERARARAQRDRDREQERRERERAGSLDTLVAFDAKGLVTVTCNGGAVIVVGGEKNEIRVRARTESGAIRFSSNGTRATLESATGRGCSDGHFEVTVPMGAKVLATTWSGSVSVRSVYGDVEAHAQSGDITIRDVGDRLDVESLSGDVRITGVKGETRINTVSGDVELSGARGNVTAESVSGDLDLRDVIARQVRTHTTSGDVMFAGQILEAGRYEFGTHSGEIGLQLPADIGAELSISTFNGGIDSDFPITLVGGTTSQAKRLTFTVGRGTAKIIAETFSGDINLRRRR